MITACYHHLREPSLVQTYGEKTMLSSLGSRPDGTDIAVDVAYFLAALGWKAADPKLRLTLKRSYGLRLWGRKPWE